MTPSERLFAVRKAMGVSVKQMADLVGLSGPHADDRVREMEDGRRPVSGPIERVLDFMEQGLDIGSSDLGKVILSRHQPKFVQLSGANPSEPFFGILHTQPPRFLAVFSANLPAPMQERLAASGLETLEMPTESALGLMVAVPLERFPGSVLPLMHKAAAHLAAQPKR
jgi:transcriptional regulator with XRE-family HTH domain